MRKEQLTLWTIFFIYFGGMSLLMWNWGWGSLWWLVGGLIGMSFVFIDRLIYVFLTKPHEHLSEHVKHLFREGRYMDGARLLQARREEQQKLTSRSVFFMGAWIPVSFFVISSTGSMAANGIVMGIGLHILFDAWKDWQDMNKLKSWMFWPIKREVKDSEVKAVMAVFAVFFVGMSLALL